MPPDFRISGASLRRSPKDQGVLLSTVALPLFYQRACKGVLTGAFLNPLTSVNKCDLRVLAIHRKPGACLQIKTSQMTRFKHVAPFYNCFPRCKGKSCQCNGKSCPILYCVCERLCPFRQISQKSGKTVTEPYKSCAEVLTKGSQGSVAGAALWCENLPPPPPHTPLLL